MFETDNRVIQMTKTDPKDYPFNLDFNSGNGLGFGGFPSISRSPIDKTQHFFEGWLHTSVGHGARSTSSSAFLHPALNTRNNLDLLLHTQVTRLVSTDGKVTFKGVQVAQSATGMLVF